MEIIKKSCTIILLILIIGSFICTDSTYSQSKTGKDWIKLSDSAAFSPRSGSQVLCFKNKLWLIGGGDKTGSANDTWYSDDGINWKQASDNNGFDRGKAVVFNEKLWVINTNGKNVWNSVDGFHWSKVATLDSAAEYATSVTVFKDKLWLTGGADVINAYLPNGELNPDRKIIWKNDVWSSSDGIKWIKQKTSSCYPNRSDHCMIVFKDKMWIIAGQSGPNKNDVWCSDDGINWTKVTDAPFTPRHVTQAVVFENKMWVLAGFAMDSTNHPIMLSDVWSSSDGKNWENVTSSAPFGKRQEHQAVVFKNKLWVIGGFSGTINNSKHKNDVWVTE